MTIFTISIVAVIIIPLLLKFACGIRNAMQPVQTAHATVICREERVLETTNSNTRPMPNTEGFIGFLTFEMDDRRRLDFTVSEALYSSVLEDDSGTLTYQGSTLISFIREEPTGDDKRPSDDSRRSG